ncbi:uncharacterized protein LOC127091238 [Lathyrus oleraceus]|uniref:uncharacterized protein LOC127091238 n=1 Tax=Pisum sativum TaxID=3888 RepID=UPI0021CF94BF|nr:uncharacterized protein LOC127091238 [Pisum sativum]
MLKKAGKDIPTKSGTKTNPKSQKEVPGQMLDKASKEIPTTSGTKSQIMMRLEKMVEESDIMHGAIRSVDMDEGVFGIAHSELIAKEDMQQLFEHEELGIILSKLNKAIVSLSCPHTHDDEFPLHHLESLLIVDMKLVSSLK